MTKYSDGGQRESLAAELARLSSLDEAELHRLWRVRIGRAVPSHLPRGLFVRLLSYKLQEQVLGGLDRSVRAKLKAAIGESGNCQGPSDSSVRLKPGTVLVREHDGDLHRVMVLEQGFAWSGKTYRSLSEAAFAITGTKWNGRRFFGLDRVERPPAAAASGRGRGRG
jgi:hypothetical protein